LLHSLTSRGERTRLDTRYFQLSRSCILVEGKIHPAIYNLETGDIVALERHVADVLSLAESRVPVDGIAHSLSTETRSVERVLSDVADRGLGSFFERRVFVEKYKDGRWTTERFVIPPLVISACYIELPSSCNLECGFCTLPKISPCAMCSDGVPGPVEIPPLRTFLRRLFHMKCEALVFHGGDPLFSLHEFLSMAEFCRAEGFRGAIYVTTNGVRLDSKMIDTLAHYGIHPVIPVGAEGSNLIDKGDLVRLSGLLRKKGVDFSLTVVINSGNTCDGQSMKDFAEGLGAKRVRQTTVLESDALASEDITRILRKRMMRVPPSVFYHNAEHHPCLHQTLAVSVDGNVLPCPFLEDEVLGNIRNPRVIDEVFESKAINQYWRMSLSQIQLCRDCGFRYGCSDCRAVEKQLTGDLHGKVLCPYPVGQTEGGALAVA
jgi:radical SAM protein with 4Fe4S-binding SPASM domain